MSRNIPQGTIQEFLSLFDNNVDAAIAALQDTRVIKRKQRPLPTTPVLLEANNVSKSYRVGHQHINALQGVSLTIHEGEFIAITGQSGSGKSTLLQLLGGLERPDSGHVTLGTTELNKLSDRKLSRFRGQTVGFVFQFFYLQPFLSVSRNIEVPAMFAHMRKDDRQKRVHELAEAVDITDRLSHLPNQLSGGQLQRAAIARALINRPSLLLADEPTGNLDSANGAAIIDLFNTIRKEYGTTVVMVTHDAKIAAKADREIQVKDGKIV